MGDWAALSELLDRLGPGDADERADAARQVYSQLEARRTAEPTSDQAAVHTNLKRWLARMASSRVQQDQLAATALLSVMVDADSLEDSEAVRMATQIKSLMQAPDMEVCVETMAVYRQLLLKRSRIVLSSVEADISRRLETLDGERSEVQRLVTLRLIEMVCGENLVPLYAYAPKLFASLTGLLCDRRLDIREAAGRALGACLGAVPLAERNPWLNVMFDDLQRSQLAGNVDSLHGSQLICRELLQNGGEYMQPHFAQTFETAMRLTTHRDGHVRRAAIEQLPMLAKYSPHEFSRIGASGESMLSRSCNYLVDLARSADSERATAFVALGQIAQHCSSEFGPFLEPAMRAIRDILAQQANAHSKNAANTSDGVTHGILQAIAMLAAAMGSALAEHMGDILDLMFAAGLSQPLCDALHALVRKVGQLQPAVLARVLDVVSVVLTGIPFRPAQQSLDELEQRLGMLSMHYAAMPSSVGRVSPAAEPAALVIRAASIIPVTTDTLGLALRTLRKFDFGQENMSEFLRNVVLEFLTHSSAAVRSEAIHTAAHLVRYGPLYRWKAGAGAEVAGEVVQRIVLVAVVDVDRDVRLMAAQMLEQATVLDLYIGKAQNVRDLSLLMDDEAFDVRLAVLAVIGRLANKNPTHVMPTLRRMVEQLLTELRYATSNQEREECIKLLTALVHAADAQGQRYVGDILQAIVSQIDSAPAQLASKLLDMVTALVRVSGSEVEPFYDELLASIVRALSSRSPSAAKRLAALRALSSCASYGDMAIAPYEECPHLFDLLATILKDSSDPLMHAEALRAVGALGAIDPHRFKNALARAANGAQMAAGGRRRERGLRKQGRALLNEMTAFRSERPDTELAGAIPAGYDGSEFTTDTYFTGIAVGALLGILNDATNRQPHREAAQALTSMFMSLKADAEPYAEQSLEAILAAMSCPATGSAHMEFYIKRIQQLVEVAPRTLLLHLPTLCRLFSTEDLGCRRQQAMSLELLKTLATELPGEFGQHIAMVVSYLIAVIDRDDCESRALTRNALSAVQVLSWLLGDHQFLFVPRLLALMDTARQSDETVAASLQCLEVLAMATNCGSFVSRIVLTLVRLLQSVPAVEVQEAIFGVLCALMEQLQDQFMQFVPTIAAVVNRRGVSSNARYVRSMQLLLEGRLVPREPPRRQPRLRESDGDARAASRQDVDLGQLRRAWTPSRDMSEENGMRWLDNLTRVLLQQSPHVSLRACSGLATRHVQLGHSLFNAAFVSCWKALSDEHQKEIAASLQSVASNQGAPTAVLQTILSLAEYMERDNEHLPIDNALLATYARRCHALAKELYYVEAAWAQGANYAAMIKLIELNQSLDLRDSAIGVLDYVHKEHSDIKDTVECYQRLQRWDDALTMYRNQADDAGHDLAHGSTMGQIHCLFALSDWGALVQMYNRIRDSNDRDLQLKSAGFGVRMAWATSDIGRMEAYLAEQPTSSGEKSFYNALLAVHQRRTSDAAEHIAQARKAINVGQLLHIAHSDIHGYAQMFQCQMLTELEEIIEFKNDGCTRERQENLIQAWNTRLGGMRQDVAKWQRALRLRSLALRPILDVDTWVALANMSRHSGDMKVARAAIDRLLNDEAEYFTEVLKNPGDFAPRVLEQAREYARLKEEMILPSRASSPQPAAQAASWRGGVRRSSIPCGLLDKEVWLSQHPAVVYTYLKYKWAKGECADALKMLRWYAQDQSERLGFDPRNPSAYKAGANAGAGEAALLARLYYRQAEWAGSVLSQQSWRGAAAESNGRGPRFQRSNTGELEAQRTHEDGPLFYETENDDADGSILESYRAATALHRKWYKAWHALALRHYLVVQRCEMTKVPITDAIAKQHAVPAVNAFFRAIQLSQGDSSPQDTLRLLLVWFKYSHIESVAQTVQDKVDRVPIRTWLQVIPQILAQININSPRIRQQVKMLLVSIGKRYPQAILFPVYVVARSHIQERKQAATDVIGSIYNRQPELVQQTECVSRELIHATLLLPERWNDALDKAWKGYQARQSDTSILAVLEAIHKATRNPATPYDRYFMRKFGQEIGAAENIVAQCLAEVDPQRRHELLDSVWAHYYHLTQRIGAELSKLRVVSFEDTAPALLTYNNLLLAIPGTYRPDEEPVTIQSIDPMVEIHKTLRRPRQMSMRGSDGVKYTFLLKGGEDLRQDERVMQLFGLVNSLLARDKDTSQRSLAIERFPVVPLSSSSGLIGFYPNCQSIQKLIECYRHAHEVPLYLERNLSRQFAPNYTTLTIAQKIELFEHVQSETPGDDLQRIMWYRSPSSEEWLARRTNYTRSLAVMSMVGYILGLGDRHLNNILIHERTGRVVHIDLGDCFETAAHRDMFPETIPFRLTRMLIKPMGVTALEGAFKRSAHYTMRVLRANRDSMMAVLEAFVFDPLMTWVVIREPEESADRASSSQQQQQPKQQEQRQQRDDRLAHSMVGKDGAAGTTWFRQVARIGEVGANTYIAPDHRRQGGNPRALAIVKRIHDKLVGCDFDRNIRLGETKQIDKLIQQATSVENLAVLFKGWGPDW